MTAGQLHILCYPSDITAFLLKKFFLILLSTVDLQCCILLYSKVTHIYVYTYVYIYAHVYIYIIFHILSTLWLSTRILNIVSCAHTVRPCSFVHSIYESLPPVNPNPHSFPPLFPPLPFKPSSLFVE